jgi:AmiR/NasT family two-component response regulator
MAEQFLYALDCQMVTEQAEGVLAERHKVTMEEAFDALRRHARARALGVAEVAAAVVRGDTDP